MQQGNNYHRFGYQPFGDNQAASPSAAPQGYDRSGYGAQGGYGAAGSGGYDSGTSSYDEILPQRSGAGGLGAMLSSPLVMTGALIAAAVVFAGILVLSYPSSDDIPQPIPIVQAESGPLKSAPEDAGGMEIANNDTTVFDAIGGQKAGARPVENLLEAAAPAAEEEPLSKQELMAKLKTQEAVSAPEIADIPAEIVKDLKTPAAAVQKTPAQRAEASAKGIPLPRPEKTGEKGPDAAPAVALHEPGASPDTIAFVRSVLEKKDGKTAASATAPVVAAAPAAPVQAQPILPAEVARVEPASGTPAPAASSSADGTHYVQVVSVPSRSAAESEWSKIQGSLASVLSGAPHRIQEANLGDKGTYYRVQLGPYDEAGAKSLCDRIKTQKPGGCFVVR